MFKKILTATVATLMIATASLSVSTPAEAKNAGVGIVAGIIGGVVVGSIIASQQPRTVVVEDDVVVCKKRLFEDEYGNRYWKRVCR